MRKRKYFFWVLSSYFLSGLLLLSCGSGGDGSSSQGPLPPEEFFVTIVADKASPGLLGTVGTVKFTAEANGNNAGGNYDYQFLIQEVPQDFWVVTQDYGNGNTWNWTPTAEGSFRIAVWAKNSGSSQDEALAWVTFDIVSTPAGPVEFVVLTADKASPGLLGTVGTVKFTAEANGDDAGGNYDYQFYIREDPQDSWVVTQDYGNGNTWNWTPTAEGSFTIVVWAKNVGSPEGEAQMWMTFDIVSTPAGPVEFVVLTADKASPGLLGTVGTVKFTAEANGDNAGGNYDYQFLIQEVPQDFWVVTQDYGNGNTWNWTPTAEGSFRIAVWAKNAGSSQDEALAWVTFDIVSTPVGFVVLTADKKSPVRLNKAGTITFTAEVNGDDSGGDYQYKFWLKKFTDVSWTMVQDYGNRNTWAWEPTEKGTYTIRVWAKGAGIPLEYQASETMSFTIN